MNISIILPNGGCALKGANDLEILEAYYDRESVADPKLRQIDNREFRNYYGLRASVAASRARTTNGISWASSMNGAATTSRSLTWRGSSPCCLTARPWRPDRSRRLSRRDIWANFRWPLVTREPASASDPVRGGRRLVAAMTICS